MKSRTTSMYRLGLFIIPLAALVVGMVTSARPVHATFLGTNGRIVFNQGDPNAPTNVFTANPDGLDQTQLPLPDGVGVELFSNAVWSPDGGKLLISHTLRVDPSTGQCCLPFRPGGVTPINLQVGTQRYSAFQPVWSPDGTRIIFCMFIDGGEGIYTANPDGSDVEQVTFTTNFNNLFNGPDWGTHPVTP